MDKLYFVLYMPSCRRDPIGLKEYDEHAQKPYGFLKENKVVVDKTERVTEDPNEKEYPTYWMLTRAENREDALDKSLAIMEESEIPNDIYKQMKLDVISYKRGVIEHCGICKKYNKGDVN